MRSSAGRATGRGPSRRLNGPTRQGIPIQVHTIISRGNAHDNLCSLFEKLAIVMWNVFFLVPVGRGQPGISFPGKSLSRYS